MRRPSFPFILNALSFADGRAILLVLLVKRPIDHVRCGVCTVTPHVGQRVWSHYGKDPDELWWAGSIIQVHHKAVDVQYEDGDIEHDKLLQRVIPIDVDPSP